MDQRFVIFLLELLLLPVLHRDRKQVFGRNQESSFGLSLEEVFSLFQVFYAIDEYDHIRVHSRGLLFHSSEFFLRSIAQL